MVISRKRATLTALAMWLIMGTANAQSASTYHLAGLVELRYSNGIGLARPVDAPDTRHVRNEEAALQLRPMVGWRLGRHALVGAGVGVAISTTENNRAWLPLFVSGRLTAGQRKVRPELLLDLGYAPALSPPRDARWFAEPGVGVRVLTYGGIPVHLGVRLAIERAARQTALLDSFISFDSPPSLTTATVVTWRQAVVVGLGVEL